MSKKYKDALANFQVHASIPGASSHLYQVVGMTVPRGESQVKYDNNWGYVLRSEPQTIRQYFNFYQCHSRTNQQAGGKIKREKLEYIYIISIW